MVFKILKEIKIGLSLWQSSCLKKKKVFVSNIRIKFNFFFDIFLIETYANTFLSLLSSLIVFSLLIKQFLNFENGIEINKIFKSNVKTGGIIAFLIILHKLSVR